MKKISNFLFQNILWKCLSVVLATSLWLVCINVVNPIVTKTYSNRLIIRNLDVVEANGYILLNKEELENQIVQMTIKAVNDSFSPINNSHFQPYIDVSPIDYLREANIGMDQPLNIYVERAGTAALSSFSPTSIETNPLKANIRLDKITEVTKPVTVTITGAAMDSYVALPGQANPDSIKITGPSTVLNRISTVSVEVDVSGASEDLILPLTPRIIDIDKKDITDKVEMDVESVEIRVPVNMYAKVPIEQKYVGSVADGYDITSITKSIEYVEVVGAEEDIKRIDSIKLQDLNVSGWSATESRSYDVRQALIDTRLSVVNGTPNEVIVTVNIEKQQKKEIIINIDDIRVIGSRPGYVVDLPSGEMLVTVKGLPDKISGFDASGILDAYINIFMLESGVHEVRVSLILPQGIYLEGDEPGIVVVISELGNEPAEEGFETQDEDTGNAENGT